MLVNVARIEGKRREGGCLDRINRSKEKTIVNEENIFFAFIGSAGDLIPIFSLSLCVPYYISSACSYTPKMDAAVFY
jgi:hypothetical protein